MTAKIKQDSEFKSIYTARVTFSADAFRRGAKVQYSVFSPLKKLFLLLLGFAMVIVGAFVMGGKTTVSILIIAAGCFIVTGINAGANNLADKAIKSMNGVYPTVNYYFGADCFKHSTTPELELSYSSVLRLVQDDRYLYIYEKDMTAFLIDKEKVFGKGRVEGFMEFMTKKTGREWIFPMTVKYLKISRIKAFLSETKKDKKSSASFDGERLSGRH